MILNRTRVTTTLAMLVLAAAAGAAHAMEADQPPTPKDSTSAAQPAPGQKPETPGQKPETKAIQTTPAPAANAGGVMVFIDPATGKIVQPTDAQIGTLAPTPQVDPKPKAPVVTIQGPGGAVGIVLTPESFSYSIATRTGDGKIAMDCVTGDQAADRIVAGQSGNTQAAPKAKGPLDEKKK